MSVGECTWLESQLLTSESAKPNSILTQNRKATILIIFSATTYPHVPNRIRTTPFQNPNARIHTQFASHRSIHPSLW